MNGGADESLESLGEDDSSDVRRGGLPDPRRQAAVHRGARDPNSADTDLNSSCQGSNTSTDSTPILHNRRTESAASVVKIRKFPKG